MNRSVVVLAGLIALMMVPSAMSEDEDENLWVVSFGLYSGRENPRIRLDQGEIEKIRSMIAAALRDAVSVASDDPNPHQGLALYYSDLDSGTSYYGINISVESKRDKRFLKLYPVAGRYLRIYSNSGNSSKLYKMANAEIEKYLINLGIQKGALSLREQTEILNSVNKAKK